MLCGLILEKNKNCKNIILSDPNKLRLNECSKYLNAKFVEPSSKDLNENGFDIIFDNFSIYNFVFIVFRIA